MLALTAAPAFAGFDEEFDPGNEAFERTWNRTDLPVENGTIERTWIWGPARTEVMTEEYADSPGGMREVQYYDKSRMEINDPDAQDDGLWYVTNGLLVVEMITGEMQVGDFEFVQREPADVQIAGDPANPFAPTDADIHALGLRDMPAEEEGELITRTLTGDNQVMEDERFAQYNVTAAERVTVPGIDHTIASPFWEFMTSSGPVWEDGQIVEDDLFENPFYAVGYPLTPAFWSVVPVLGAEQDVLWQCFERRCLTYTPSNNEGFQVEAGNVGQHYYTWRYGGDEPGPGPEPEPEPDFDGTYYAQLAALNESGVSGTATLTLEGDQLTVHLEASGLEPNQLHLQHIHGFSDVDETEDDAHLHQAVTSVCPNPEMDTNGDGLIELEEGLPAYGPVLVSLDPAPTADDEGNVEYDATLTVDPSQLLDPTKRVIVLHGMTVDEEYVATLPVACGPIEEGEPPEEPEPPAEPMQYLLSFGELNNSGVSAAGTITQDGDEIHVRIIASGLTPDETHMQHIHGQEEGAAFCPGPDFDTDGSGMLELPEGVPAYGGVIVGLFDDVEAETYPTASAEGSLAFEMTYTVDAEALGDLSNRVVVLHGMTVDEEYDPALPVACSLIVPAEGVSYAALQLSGDNVLPDPVESDGSGSAWFWHDVEGDVIYYMLLVEGIEDITAAHIHAGSAEESGGVIVPLFVGLEEGESVSGFGILASGRITADDLSGDLEGMTLEDLVALFGTSSADSEAYVNVHSLSYPPGEIRDQVRPVLMV